MNIYEDLRKQLPEAEQIISYFKQKWMEIPQKVEELAQSGVGEIATLEISTGKRNSSIVGVRQPTVKIHMVAINELVGDKHIQRVIVFTSFGPPTMAQAVLARALAFDDFDEVVIRIPPISDDFIASLANPAQMHLIKEVKDASEEDK